MSDYANLSDAYDPDERCGECPDEDAILVSSLEVAFQIPVAVTQAQMQVLHDLVCEITCEPWNQPKEGQHWAAGSGSKPHYSRADAAFLGVQAEEDAPLTGEPTYDSSVFFIETCARPFVADDERDRTQKERTAGKFQYDWMVRQSEAHEKLKYLVEYIKRMEAHSATQIEVSCKSPSWIGYNNAIKHCLEELERFDLARQEKPQ